LEESRVGSKDIFETDSPGFIGLQFLNQELPGYLNQD